MVECNVLWIYSLEWYRRTAILISIVDHTSKEEYVPCFKFLSAWDVSFVFDLRPSDKVKDGISQQFLIIVSWWLWMFNTSLSMTVIWDSSPENILYRSGLHVLLDCLWGLFWYLVAWIHYIFYISLLQQIEFTNESITQHLIAYKRLKISFSWSALICLGFKIKLFIHLF